MSGQQMTIRRESAAPAGSPFVGVNELLFNELTGELLVKMPDGSVRRVNQPDSPTNIITPGDADRVMAPGLNNRVVGGQDGLVLGNNNYYGKASRSLLLGSQIAVGTVFPGDSTSPNYSSSTKTFTYDADGNSYSDSDLLAGDIVALYDFINDLFVFGVVASHTASSKTIVFSTDPLGFDTDIDALISHRSVGGGSNGITAGSWNANGGNAIILIGDKNMARRGSSYGIGIGSGLRLMKDADRVFVQARNIIVDLATGRFFNSRTINGKFDDGKVVEVTFDARTTNATPTKLFINDDEGKIPMEDDTLVWVEGWCMAKCEGTAEYATYTFKGLFHRGTGAASVSKVDAGGGVTIEHEDTAAWDFAMAADTSGGGVKFTVTGEASKNIGWFCYVRFGKVLTS